MSESCLSCDYADLVVKAGALVCPCCGTVSDEAVFECLDYGFTAGLTSRNEVSVGSETVQAKESSPEEPASSNRNTQRNKVRLAFLCFCLLV